VGLESTQEKEEIKMPDFSSDQDAAVYLVTTEYQRLQEHNPKHSLLKYLHQVSGDGFIYSGDGKVMEEFLDRYAPGEEPVAVMLARYYVVLRDAVDGIEGIDRSPKKKEIKPVEAIVDDEPLPF